MSYDPDHRRDTPLALILKERIARNGPMSVAEYMSECLWNEQHGYYATKTVFGRTGDFITAAEISQIFGELMGLWAGVVWREVMGAPPQVTLAEYGPGRGTMMRDALRAARVIPGFSDALSVHLIEMSHGLIAEQRETLQASPAPLSWGSNLIGFPSPAIVVANEFLDAWPVEQWLRTADGWKMRGVVLDANGALQFTALDCPQSAMPAWRRTQDAPEGTLFEYQKPQHIADAFAHLAAQGPLAVVLIDYGYTTPSHGESLQAVRNHRYEHPLTSPGEADLSAHVDFFELAQALHAAGLELDGPVTQAEFLGALGIVERASRLMAANPKRAGEIETGVARLIAPVGMGTQFKALGVRSKGLPQLPGFSASR